MAIYSTQQIAQTAASAGFKGNGLVMAIAIALAESGGNTTVISSAGDVGLWQVNMAAHPQYSMAWLQNPANNAAAAYAISSGGTNWRPWCTAYSDGACGTRGGTFQGAGSPYQKYLIQAQAYSGTQAGMGSQLGTTSGTSPSNVTGGGRWEPAYLKQFIQWLDNPNTFIFGRWEGFPEGGFEGGMDLSSPGGTPVLALGTGPIVGAGYFCHSPANFAMTSPSSAACNSPGYGVVTQRINVPGYGLQDIYYQHIDIAPGINPVFNGQATQSLQKGQQVGTIRSNVGMLEIGFNANWGTIWGTNHPGPWYTDPRPLVKNLVMAGPPGNVSGSVGGASSGLSFSSGIAGTYVPLLDQVHATLVNAPGFYGIALALDEAEQFPGYVDLTTPQSLSIPSIDTGMGSIGGGSIPIPDINGTIRSIGATITDNFVPFAIRSGITLLGALILMAILWRVVEGPIQSVAPLLEMAA